MENTIDNIERINHYINKTLSEADRLAFEKQLQTDGTFNTLYTEHLVILEGVKRVDIKTDILAAQKHYALMRWIKLLGISISALILAIVVYFSFFSTSTIEPPVNLPAQKILTIDNSSNIENSVITDSVKKYILVYKRDSLIVDKSYKGITAIKETELVSYLEYSSIEAIKIDFPEIKSLKAVKDTIRYYKKYTYEMLKTKIDAITKASDKGDNEDRNVSETIEDTISTETVLKQNNIVKDSIITEVPEPLSPELIAFYKSVKKAPETITVDMEKGATITLKEGTQLTIAPKSLAYKKTNRIARGKIKLEVTEYYKLSDILLANLITKSDDNLLETGGMLFIKASKNGKALKLADTKTLSISFPYKGKKGMQLFSGEQHNNEVNWKLNESTTGSPVIRNVLNVFEEHVEVALDVVEKVPTYPGCEKATENKIRRECLNRRIDDFVRQNYNTEIAENLNITGKNRISIFFKISKTGRIIDIQASAPHQKLAEEAIRVIRLLPKMEPAMQRERTVRVPYYLPINVTLEGVSKYSPPIRVRDEGDITGVINDKLAIDSTGASVTKNDLERYTFATSKLGWINCDRFARISGKRVRFRLKIKDAGNANLKLVFKSMSAILPSKKYKNSFDFGTVPADETVVLVAIKKIRDKIYLGVKETETKQISELDLEFKEVTIEELKGALIDLNDDFD